MKKLILIICIIFSIVCCCTSCNNEGLVGIHITGYDGKVILCKKHIESYYLYSSGLIELNFEDGSKIFTKDNYIIYSTPNCPICNR